MRRENRSFWKVLDQWTHKKEADPPALAFMLFVLVQYTPDLVNMLKMNPWKSGSRKSKNSKMAQNDHKF